VGQHLIELAPPKMQRPRTIGFFLQRGSHLISEQMWQGMLEFVSFAATALPGVRVLVRDHPGAPLNTEDQARLLALPSVRLASPSAVPLGEVLKECDIVVSLFSTTILEGIGAGAVPLVVNVTSMPSYYPDVQGEGAGVEVKDFGVARDALCQLCAEGTGAYARGLASLQKRLFASAGETALERIASHLSREFRL
jgi:hypothetical protein